MKLKYKVILFLAFVMSTVTSPAQTLSYKCMIQMDGYPGDGAYIAISLLDEKDQFIKTLYVLGSNKKWHPDLKEWHANSKKKTENVDAITGASVSGGDRKIVTLNLEEKWIGVGYKMRFETAVEDNPHHSKDAEVLLTNEALAAKTDGTGYIKYIRFSAN